jgi:glutathione S-transferase
VADAYLFTVLGWAGNVKIDLTNWQKIVSYKEKIAIRPKVIEALKAEGLLKG